MGDGVGSPESYSSTNSYRSKKTRRKRDIWRGLVIWNVCLVFRFSLDRVTRGFTFPNSLTQYWSLFADHCLWLGWLPLRLVPGRDRASHVLLPCTQSGDREAPTSHLWNTDH